MDEPTTGLDSFTATSVIETLKELAQKKGKTIIQTIHQPNSDMFEIFDRLMLLARGQVIYFNEAKHAVEHFSQIGYNCPEMSNPADYFMSIMSYETVEQEVEEGNEADQNLSIPELYAKKIKMFSDAYQNSELKNDPDEMYPGLQALTDADLVQSDASWFYQFGLLCSRNFTNIMRLPMTSYVKLIVTVMTAGFCVLLFNGIKDLENWQEGVQNRRGALFFITMTMAFNAIQNVILIFPDERPVFLREANNNMYKVSAYFWAKIVSEFPSSLLTPVIFGSIVYFIIGLNDELWFKFPMFCKFHFLFLSHFYSGHPVPDLQCLVRVLADYRYPVLRQAAGRDPDSRADHSIHAIRRVLRRPEQHSFFLDCVPILVNLQVRVPGVDAERVQGSEP